MHYLSPVTMLMGLEAPGWVLLYIAAFGVSDTLVALVAPNSPYLFFYYSLLGFMGFRLLHLSDKVPRVDGNEDV